MNGHRIDLPEMPVGAKFTGEYIDGGVKITHQKQAIQPIIGRTFAPDYITPNYKINSLSYDTPSRSVLS